MIRLGLTGPQSISKQQYRLMQLNELMTAAVNGGDLKWLVLQV